MTHEIDAASEDSDNPERWRSADPDFEKLWDLSLSELQEIENDETHALHEKAKIVGREMMAPMIKALEASSLASQAALTKDLGEWARIALTPAIDAASELSKAYSPGILKTGEILAAALSAGARRAIPGPIDIGSSPVVVDFTADELPDATAAEIHDAAQADVVERLSAMLSVAEEQLEHLRNRAEADDQRAVQLARRERILDARHLDTTKLSRSGVIGGWTAAGIAGLSIIVAILLASGQFD